MGRTIEKFIRIAALLAAFSLIATVSAQIPGKMGYRIIAEGEPPPPMERLLSNSVIDMIPGVTDIYMGTGGGLSVWHYDIIADDWFWQSYGEKHGIGEGSISALGLKDDVLWAATAFTESTPEGALPAGGGVGFSTDFGASWTWFPQPVDPTQGYDTTVIAEPTTTHIQNVTYDLLITSTEVWTTSFGGGLRKFDFSDSTWYVVTPDANKFSALANLNHRAFSVVGDDSILWVGTASGINKSTDGGETWVNYNHLEHGLSGNFVTAMGRQQYGDKDVLWAATWQAQDTDEDYGVTKTENGGISWEVVLSLPNETLQAHNFAFDDSIVYVATNVGLYKSIDYGDTWELFPQIVDSETGNRIYDPEIYSAVAHLTMLWVGTGDGLASSLDYGNTWTIYRSYVSTTRGDQPSTYAYPNPFSPRLHNVIRFQYDMDAPGRVTLKIFDFAMDEVVTVVDDESRGEGDYFEEWTGKRSNGEEIATGVYFYRVERSGHDPVWGKFAIIY